MANSVAVNVFNRIPVAGREWVNTALLALVNGLPAILLLGAQYTTLFITGDVVPELSGSSGMWLIQTVPIVIAAAVVSRKIYNATGNPYLGGLVNALAVSLIAVSNTIVVAG